MPATLNIDQIISSPRVVSKTDSLFCPGIRESVRRRFHSLIQNPPFHRTSFACHTLPYNFTSNPQSTSKPKLPRPKKHSSIQPTTSNKETPDFFISRKKKRIEKERKKWNTTVPSTEALPVGASICVLVGPEPIVEVMGFPIRLLRNFLIL